MSSRDGLTLRVDFTSMAAAITDAAAGLRAMLSLLDQLQVRDQRLSRMRTDYRRKTRRRNRR